MPIPHQFDSHREKRVISYYKKLLISWFQFTQCFGTRCVASIQTFPAFAMYTQQFCEVITVKYHTAESPVYESLEYPENSRYEFCGRNCLKLSKSRVKLFLLHPLEGLNICLAAQLYPSMQSDQLEANKWINFGHENTWNGADSERNRPSKLRWKLKRGSAESEELKIV